MKTKRIFVADDEVSFTVMLKINLETSGAYEVAVENDPAFILERARQFRPDLILLDIVMPGLDGGDIKRRLLADDALRAVPVIFLTAMAEAGVAPTSFVAPGGPDMVLAKPVSLDELTRCIEEKLATSPEP